VGLVRLRIIGNVRRFAGDRITSTQPAAEINIGAAPRTERSPSLCCAIVANRTPVRGGLGVAVIRHIREVSHDDPE
jgi:hypothetical protein